MINIMYLVLTALLALNVSSEVLNAFKTVNTSLDNSSFLIDGKNKTLFASFAEKMNDPKAQDLARLWLPKAQQAQKLSDEVFQYITTIEDSIKLLSGYKPEQGESSFEIDRLDIPSYFMVEKKGGDKLLQRLTQFKSQLLAIDPAIANNFKNSLPLDLSIPQTEDKSNKTWSLAYFNMTPSIAAITILKKFQNDVKNSGSQVVEFCYSQLGQPVFIPDKSAALALASSQYVLPGQPLSIFAGVGAFSSKAAPRITIDGVPATLGPDGLAEGKFTAGAPGSYVKHVVIVYTNPDGSQKTITKDVPYTVGAPSGLSVSADKVRVLYIGLDNPITVAGGNSKTAPQASITNGSISSAGNGHFIARVTRPGVATINVTSDGKTTPFEFRVKEVPSPVAMVGGSKGGRMRANEFRSQEWLRAELENFVFEGVEFKITSYTIVFNGAGFPNILPISVNGNSLGAAAEGMRNVRPGTTVSIDEIRATGPGGSRTLPPVVFNLY